MSKPFYELDIELGTAYNDGPSMGASASRDILTALRIKFDLLIPFDMDYPDKSACKRIARLYWLSYLTGRDVTTSRDLSKGEAVRILRWLDGQSPLGTDDLSEHEATLNEMQRETELQEWLLDKERAIKIRVVTRPGRRRPKPGGKQSKPF